jgi:hypothetical protein
MLFTGLILKHIIVDILIQYLHPFPQKEKYGSRTGIAHALTHGVATMMMFFPLVQGWAALFGAFDAIAHYHIDYIKAKSPRTKGAYVLDQFAHLMTYIIILEIYDATC